MQEKEIAELLKSKFHKNVEILVKAPGRINVIGEHTDYNQGFVLPAAINYYMYFAVAKNDSDTFNIYSKTYDRLVSLKADNLVPESDSWLNLLKGIIFQLKDRIGGFDMVFFGEIPVGAGLSSSAALCCGTAMALNNLFSLDLGKWDLAKIAQKSEHDFVNVKCGIMDQFACLFGKSDHVLLLDCETYEFEESKIDISGSKFFLFNSNVQHELNESDYNARRVESATALEMIKEINPKVDTFKDVTVEEIQSLESDETYWKRAYHIVTENLRVQSVSTLLKKNNVDLAGKLIYQGHESQKVHYEITCEETDFLVNELAKEKDVYGARQVGGGFGGCILGIAKDDRVDEVIDRVNASYNMRFNKQVTKIPIQISKGCHLMEVSRI